MAVTEFGSVAEAARMVEKFDLPARFEGTTVVAASMFAGKSETLIACALAAERKGIPVQAFYSAVDTRRQARSINTLSGQSYPAMPLENAEEIFLHLKDETRVVVIDEGQFLGDELVAVAYGLGRVGKRVIVGGLDADFRGVPFPAMSRLMLSANEVYHPTARCEVCDGPATRTQRLKVVEGGTRPADYSEPIIVVGDKAGVEEGPKEPTDVYEPRCMDHHEVPNPRHLDFDPSHVRSFLGLDGEISVRTLPVHEMWRQVEILLRAPTSIAPEELPKLRERLKPYLEKLP